jgi:hypothetical protein
MRKKLLCRLFGHDRMVTSERQRVCQRCGMRETLRQYGRIAGWEEIAPVAVPGSKA